MSEALDLKILGHCQEGVQLLLCHVDLAVVHEVQHRLKLRESNALQVEEWVGVGVLAENTSEEWGAGGQDQLVCLDVLVTGAHGQGHVEKVLLFPQFSERYRDVGLKIIPPEAEFFRCRHLGGGEGLLLVLNAPEWLSIF